MTRLKTTIDIHTNRYEGSRQQTSGLKENPYDRQTAHPMDTIDDLKQLQFLRDFESGRAIKTTYRQQILGSGFYPVNPFPTLQF